MFGDRVYDSEAEGAKNTKYNLHSARSNAKTGFHLSSRNVFAIDLKIFGSIMANSMKTWSAFLTRLRFTK